MRFAAFSLCILLAGGPAHAQSAHHQSVQSRMDANLRDSQLRAQQDLINRQMIALQNQLTALEGQARTERAIADVRAQAYTPRIPPASGTGAHIDTGQLAAIPDDRLAASNARVRAAAENRR